ncbi:MAG: YfiT family bacillithiol transferase [Acidobacteriaceae bacterium]
MATSGSDPLFAFRYPIGRFDPASVGGLDHKAAIAILAALPENLRSAVSGLDDSQLDTPYREGGWTVRQVVHHVADSHAQAYGRLRLALTEDWPTITPYNEKAWAELPDAKTGPVIDSLDLLQALHRRWVLLLESLAPEQWERGYVHPEGGRHTVKQMVAVYDWHSRHHLAQIEKLRERMGW